MEEEVQAKEDGEMDVDKKDKKAIDGESEEVPVESQVSGVSYFLPRFVTVEKSISFQFVTKSYCIFYS